METLVSMPGAQCAQELPVSDLFILADKLRDLRVQKKNLEARVKDLNEQIEHTEQGLVGEMVNVELQNFSRAGQMFYLSTKIYASAVADRKPELFSWLKKNGYGDMVQEQVNAMTLAAWVREQVGEDDELPKGVGELVNVFHKQTVSMRKAGK